MRKSTFSEEQIAYALRKAESGTAIADVVGSCASVMVPPRLPPV